MQAAITQLQETLRILEENEPINRKEGKIEQAELEAFNAAQIRWAIEVLKAASLGPIWLSTKALSK